ncbi:hypothetical protein E3N88_14175 [Mikania micrantha]|uniref:Uncharacterized protein n=1 Tax=Mikania micrantha TaxID=192012 RepID=A0A5N6P3S8_9ASTR|nr:hypothetical protein E3N88_14175 [Mikania micrantha]
METRFAKENGSAYARGFANQAKVRHCLLCTTMDAPGRVLRGYIPQIWPKDLSDQLYFHVELVPSYAWTPRTPDFVSKRVRYESWKW